MSAIVATLLLLSLAAPGHDAEETYQEALYRRKVLGDLEGAVALFERAAQPGATTELRAHANLQRAICLHDLGRLEEASRTLEALAEDLALLGVGDVRDRVAAERRLLEPKLALMKAEARGDTEEIKRLKAQIEELENAERATVPTVVERPPSAPDWEERMRRLREEKEKGRERATRLFAKARSFELRGDLETALALLIMAEEDDPENVAVRETLRAIRSRVLGSARPTDDPRSALAYQREIHRELVPREVDALYEAGRQRFAEGDYDAAADLFLAIIQLRRDHPGLAHLIVDRFKEARDFLEQAVDKGARPSGLPVSEDGTVAAGWVERLYALLDEVRGDPETLTRFYPLARLAGTRRPAGGGGSRPVRVVRPAAYPARALTELIRLRVARGTWEQARYAVEVAEGTLVVRHVPAAQRQVEALLASLADGASSSKRVAFDVAVLTTDQLRLISGALAVRFVDRGPLALAVLDARRLAAWGRRTRDVRRIGQASGVAPAGRPLRLDATRTENAIVGHHERLSQGRVVRIPRVRTLWEGIRLDVIALPQGSGTAIGLEGEVARLEDPVVLRSADEPALKWPAGAGRRFALADEAPPGGALLLTGLVSPFAPHRPGDVLCVVVVPDGLPEPADGASAEDGIPVADLSVGADVPAPLFEMEMIGGGPRRPHSRAEMVREMLSGRSLTVTEREGHLVATGERREEGREALRRLLDRRGDLLEVRSRAVPLGGDTAIDGSELPVEGDASVKAWKVSGESPLPEGPGRLAVDRVYAENLRRVHLSRVETNSYVREHDTDAGGGGARAVFGRAGPGLVIDVRAAVQKDAILLSAVVKCARLESVGHEEVRYDATTGTRPVTVPMESVRCARILVRLEPDQRVVLIGLPDPFGEGKARIAIEIEVRRISR